jgi:hypothetical protein
MNMMNEDLIEENDIIHNTNTILLYIITHKEEKKKIGGNL